jgi:hypothetical protein
METLRPDVGAAELAGKPGSATAAGEKSHHDEGSRTSLKAGRAVIGADEKRLVRKLDMHLIPLVMALYLFSFLDR